MRKKREPFPHLAQRWDRICIALLTRLDRSSVRFSVADMASLPFDRVLRSYETPGQVRFDHIRPELAQAQVVKGVDNRGEAVTHTPLMGRWHKIAGVLLWKYFRDGVTLKRAAIEELDESRVLLMEPHEDEIELRFVSRADARVIAAKERFDTGRSLIEKVGTDVVQKVTDQQLARPRFGRRRR